MKFDPFVPKVESCVAVGRLPEKVGRPARLFRNALNVRAFQKGRCEGFSVIEVVRRKFEAKAHEVVGLLRELALGGMSVFEDIIHKIMIVKW